MARRATLLAFLAALAYFLAFHRYGLFVQDEGVIAYQALRVARGQLPYRDFQTAYTPASFYLHALLFKLAAPRLSLLRASGAVTCAVAAALLLVAALQVLPIPWAFLPSALYVLLEDQESGGFVVHTIPYPSRYITALWALSLCLTLAYARRRRQRLVVALGLTAAAIAAFKHTAGLYNAWAVGLCLVAIGGARHAPAAAQAASTRGACRLAALLPVVFLLLVVAALPLLFGGFARCSPGGLVLFSLPVAAACVVLLYGSLSRSHRGAVTQEVLAHQGMDLVRFAAAALVPTVGWVTYFGWRVGWGVLARRLVLDGPAAARSFALAMPGPGSLAKAALLLAGLAVGARLLQARGYISARTAARSVGLAATALFVTAVAAGAGLLPRFSAARLLLALNHVGRVLDNLAFYVVSIVAYAFLPELHYRRRRPLDPMLLCWLHGICQLLVAYPRLDVAHLYDGAPILLIAGTELGRRVLAFVRAGAPHCGRALAGVAACSLLLLGVVKLAPRLAAQLAWDGGVRLRPRRAFGGPRGGLYATDARGAGSWLATLKRAVELVTERTAPGTPIFAYPALPAVYFLSGRPNAAPLDYFFRGFGEGRDEVAVVAALARARVPLAVVMDDESFDPSSRRYFPILKDYLRRNFVQTDALPPLRILTSLHALGVPGEASLFPRGLRQGSFARGDLGSFRADALNGGMVEVVKQGTSFSGLPHAAEIPFPGGPGSYAVRLRSRGDGTRNSVAILTSLPFVPTGPELSFAMLSESAAVHLELLFLEPWADVLHPARGVIRRLVLPIEHPGTGRSARFTKVRVPFPAPQGHPLRIQFRQHTLEPQHGYFTLITDVRAGPPAYLPDRDRDGVEDAIDNCPGVANPDQTNSDGDRAGDACDNCPYIPNSSQADRDRDGIGDRCATDIDGDGFTDEKDVAILAAALAGDDDPRCDFDGDGRVGLRDVALFARALRVGLATDSRADFQAFADHSINGGIARVLPRGTVISNIPGSDLIASPHPFALVLRSDEAGTPSAVGVRTSPPFVPDGPRLTVSVLSESADVAATLLVLRPTRTPQRPAASDVLLVVPLRNDHPGTGPGARFTTQSVDITRWFDAARPLHSPRIQIQLRQHTTRPGFGYFTLIGDIRTGP